MSKDNRFGGGRRIDFDGKDQFFTKSHIAKKYVDKVNSLFPLSDYDYVLESSAGSGAFLDEFPENKLGMDIESQREDIIEQDFLTYFEDINKSYITIGNPPFGRASKLAIEFFNHSAKFCDTIAYVIPNTWRFNKVQERLDSRYKLVYEEVVEPFAFIKIGKSPGKRHMEDGSINVNCVFQVWTRRETDMEDLRVSEPLPTSHPDFTPIGYFATKENLKEGDEWNFLLKAWGGMPFAKRGPSPYSFGAVWDNADTLKGNWQMQYLGIQAHTPHVRGVFESIPIEQWWTEVSSMNTITLQLLIMVYEKYKKKYLQENLHS